MGWEGRPERRGTCLGPEVGLVSQRGKVNRPPSGRGHSDSGRGSRLRCAEPRRGGKGGQTGRDPSPPAPTERLWEQRALSPGEKTQARQPGGWSKAPHRAPRARQSRTGAQACLDPASTFLWQLWPASSWPHLGLTLAFLGSLRALQQSRNPPSGTLGTGAFVLYLRAGACEQISRVTRGNVWLPGVAVGAICSPVLEPPLEPPRPAGPQGAL